MTPFRLAVAEFIFDAMDVNCDYALDHQRILQYYTVSNFPDVLNGFSTPQQKVDAFYNALGYPKNMKIKLAQLVDYFITRSLSISDDYEFKETILAEFNLSSNDLLEFLKINYKTLNMPMKQFSTGKKTFVASNVSTSSRKKSVFQPTSHEEQVEVAVGNSKCSLTNL